MCFYFVYLTYAIYSYIGDKYPLEKLYLKNRLCLVHSPEYVFFIICRKNRGGWSKNFRLAPLVMFFIYLLPILMTVAGQQRPVKNAQDKHRK